MDFSLKQTEWVRYDGGRHPVSSVGTDIRVRAIRDFRDEVLKATKKAVEIGKATAVELAPEGGPHGPGERRTKLKEAIEIDHTKEFWRGGAGGGGSYSARLFVVTALAPHAAYLFTGTGIYGPKHERIFYGKEVRFFWWRQRKPMAVTSIAGMEPQTDWWTAAQKAVEAELDRRLSGIRAHGINNANS